MAVLMMMMVPRHTVSMRTAYDRDAECSSWQVPSL